MTKFNAEAFQAFLIQTNTRVLWEDPKVPNLASFGTERVILCVIPDPGLSPSALFDTSSLQNLACRILHEIGHFFAAPERRRGAANFGIPENKGSLHWDTDEAKAVLIQNYLAERLSLPQTPVTDLELRKGAVKASQEWFLNKDIKTQLNTFLKGVSCKTTGVAMNEDSTWRYESNSPTYGSSTDYSRLRGDCSRLGSL